MPPAVTICAIALVGILLFPRAAATALESGGRGLQQLFTAAHAKAGAMSSAILTVIRRAATVSPLQTLGGILVSVAALPVARSEFEVTRRSILLVWTDEIASDRVALSLVLMTFAVGLLMHALQSRVLRPILGCIALSLTLMTATLAYDRTIELEKIQLLSDAALSVPPSDTGTLTIGGQLPAEGQANPSSAVPRPDRLPAFLAGLLALLLSLGGIVVGFGAFSLAGPALIAAVAFPALVLLALFVALVRLADIVFTAILTAAPAFIEACLCRLAGLVRFVNRLLPPTWTMEGDASRRGRALRAAQFDAEVSERAAKAERLRFQRAAEGSRRERHQDFLLREQERDARSLSDALEASRQQVKEAHLAGTQELLDILAQQRRAFFTEAVSDAFQNIRAHAAKVPLQVVSMLFWPLDRVWRMIGENLSPDTPDSRHAPRADPPASTSKKEDSAL